MQPFSTLFVDIHRELAILADAAKHDAPRASNA
jgi:hypothetical protein